MQELEQNIGISPRSIYPLALERSLALEHYQLLHAGQHLQGFLVARAAWDD